MLYEVITAEDRNQFRHFRFPLCRNDFFQMRSYRRPSRQAFQIAGIGHPLDTVGLYRTGPAFHAAGNDPGKGCLSYTRWTEQGVKTGFSYNFV